MNKEGLPIKRKIIERDQIENLELERPVAEMRTSLDSAADLIVQRKHLQT